MKYLLIILLFASCLQPVELPQEPEERDTIPVKVIDSAVAGVDTIATDSINQKHKYEKEE